MRVAIYARFSSDLQDARSITDQLALAREHAARQGWLVVAEFTDAASSGASMANRPGLQDLMRSAQARLLDAVLTESLDRLSRDEYETLTSANAAYREKFGFPFVICVRDHDKASILTAAQERVHNDPDSELRAALAEIARIAHHRLEALPA